MDKQLVRYIFHSVRVNGLWFHGLIGGELYLLREDNQRTAELGACEIYTQPEGASYAPGLSYLAKDVEEPRVVLSGVSVDGVRRLALEFGITWSGAQPAVIQPRGFYESPAYESLRAYVAAPGNRLSARRRRSTPSLGDWYAIARATREQGHEAVKLRNEG